ncbi:MAG: glycosyltransferase family 2 protein [Planctomycetota bacterium]
MSAPSTDRPTAAIDPASGAAVAPPTVRIVTPSFNQAAYVEATIESVLNQDYPHLTYFVADGGSQDNTVEILRRRLRPDQWRSRKDGGQVDCLIESFAQGDEEILGFVNSDDLLFPGAVSAAANLFAADPNLAVVYGEGAVIDSRGKVRFYRAVQPMDPEQLEESCWIMQPATFFRRSWYDRVGGLDRRLSKAFDYEFWLKLLRAGAIWRPLERPMAVFRLHESSYSVALWKDFLPEELAVQWWHGRREHFARRYAAARLRLVREASLSAAEADQFLAERLDSLLAGDPWREELPQARDRFAALGLFERSGFKRARWYRFPLLLTQLALHPGALPSFLRLLAYGRRSGYWAMNRRRAGYTARQRRQSRQARAHLEGLPRLTVAAPAAETVAP